MPIDRFRPLGFRVYLDHRKNRISIHRPLFFRSFYAVFFDVRLPQFHSMAAAIHCPFKWFIKRSNTVNLFDLMKIIFYINSTVKNNEELPIWIVKTYRNPLFRSISDRIDPTYLRSSIHPRRRHEWTRRRIFVSDHWRSTMDHWWPPPPPTAPPPLVCNDAHFRTPTSSGSVCVYFRKFISVWAVRWSFRTSDVFFLFSGFDVGRKRMFRHRSLFVDLASFADVNIDNVIFLTFQRRSFPRSENSFS